MDIKSSNNGSPDLTHDEKKIRPNNGWNSEIEALIADWSDRAQCYRWMHDKTSRTFAVYNQYMMIPIIVLSTLTGTANFGLDSIFKNDTSGKTIASLGIGGVSIVTGIISTLANFLRYGQGSESHSVSSLMWAKFSRLISIEMALHPHDRMEAFAFLKMFRIELDRLVEQSPPIPESVILQFKREFRANTEVKKPDVTGVLEHTKVYENKSERLKQVAVDASMMLLQKKKFFKDLVMEEIDEKVRKLIADSKAKGSPVLDRANVKKNSLIPEDDQIDIIIDVDNEEDKNKNTKK
jgi:hypothetical protein